MSRYFTKFAASVLVTLGLAGALTSTAHAQGGTTTNEDIIRPITKQGSAAFLFTLGGLGTFNIGAPGIPGMSGGVGAKWFLADDVALRVLLGLSNSNDSAAGSPSSFGIGVGVEYHFRPLYSTSPYIGAEIGYSSASRDVGTSTDKTNIFGISALAGFDWFFTRGIAAGAEMALGFKSEGGTNPGGSSKTSVTTINLATNGNVHLVVYF